MGRPELEEAIQEAERFLVKAREWLDEPRTHQSVKRSAALRSSLDLSRSLSKLRATTV